MVKIERHTPGHVSGRIKIKRVVWNITAAFLFRPFITPAFRKWRIALLRLFGAKMGCKCLCFSKDLGSLDAANGASCLFGTRSDLL